jgi:hypothetical protein
MMTAKYTPLPKESTLASVIISSLNFCSKKADFRCVCDALSGLDL